MNQSIRFAPSQSQAPKGFGAAWLYHTEGPDRVTNARPRCEDGPVRVAVHQPNYAPWCGYFAKMLASDAFVFLDDAQLPQGRSWVSRVKIAKEHDAEQWLTVPVRKDARPIREVEFAEDG